jgi:hypothetical protein
VELGKGRGDTRLEKKKKKKKRKQYDNPSQLCLERKENLHTDLRDPLPKKLNPKISP